MAATCITRRFAAISAIGRTAMSDDKALVPAGAEQPDRESTLEVPKQNGPVNEVSGNARMFPVVGIGSSAGGLEALKKLLTATPPDSGMAFVLIQHLDPTHESLMVDLLARYTTMKVVQIENDMPVEPD
jgi:chemotaxis response regulator CheB